MLQQLKEKIVGGTHQADIQLFTIYDSKTMSYGAPTFAANHLDLQRSLINMFKEPEQKNNKYLVNAEDYSIFRIGSFDKKSGQLVGQNLEHVVNLHDLRAMAQPDSGIVPT